MTLLKLIANCINFVTQDDETFTWSSIDNYDDSPSYKAFIKNALPEINRAIQEIVISEKLRIETITINADDLTTQNNFYKYVISDFLNSRIYKITKIEAMDSDGNVFSPIEFKHFYENGLTLLFPIIDDATYYIKFLPKISMLTESDMSTENTSDVTDVSYDEINELADDLGLTVGDIYRIIDLPNKPYVKVTSTSTYSLATESDLDDVLGAVDNSKDLTEIGLDDTICQAVIPYYVKANLWQEIEPEMAQLERNKGLQNLSMYSPNQEEVYQSYVSTSVDWGGDNI